MPKPDWLPDIVSTDGGWNGVCAMLYGIYEADLVRTSRTVNRLPVFRDRRILEGEVYEEGFWHLVTRNDRTTGDRLFDPRRAERLPWCGPTISNATNAEVKTWEYKEANGRIRIYVWLEALDYVVILEKRPHRKGQVAFLVTAYYIDYPSMRKSLQRKYDNRVN